MKKLLLLVALLSAPVCVLAQEAGLVLTGRTHAMVYPCTCPLEPSGGVSRRASAVKEFARRRIPYLLVDAGDCFAGGAMDQYTQGAALDKFRTGVNLRAMEAMGYDCAGLGESELEFGWEFFRSIIGGLHFPFVSCNVEADGIRPYFIKRAGKVMFGVTALSPESLRRKLPEGAQMTGAEEALRGVVRELREKGCSIIVLLSNIEEKRSLELVRQVPGIDVLVVNRPMEDTVVNADATLVLKPSWQARKLGKAVFSLSGGVIEGMKYEETVLSDRVPEDREISRLVPVCLADTQCRKRGFEGKCVDAGKVSAQCAFTPAPRVSLTVIDPRECSTCRPSATVKGLEEAFPGLEVTTLPYPGAEAEKLLKELGIKLLPAYLLGREAEKEPVFEKMKENLEPAGAYWRIKPQATGYGFFPGRPRMKDRIDVFLSLFQDRARDLLLNIREFEPQVRFLAVEENGELKVPHGKAEFEEDLRAVCVKKYYPGFFYQYLVCRASDPQSSWWDVCLDGVDTETVRRCALGGEGRKLLEENTALGRELGIISGPSYLYENREIFTSADAPSKQELRKVLIRD